MFALLKTRNQLIGSERGLKGGKEFLPICVHCHVSRSTLSSLELLPQQAMTAPRVDTRKERPIFKGKRHSSEVSPSVRLLRPPRHRSLLCLVMWGALWFESHNDNKDAEEGEVQWQWCDGI